MVVDGDVDQDVVPIHLEQHFDTTNVVSYSVSNNKCCVDKSRMLFQTHSTFLQQTTQQKLSENTPNVVRSSLAQHFCTTIVDRFVDRIFCKGLAF